MHRDENGTLYIESITGCAAMLDGDWSPIQAEGDIGFVEGFVEDPESPRPTVISDRGIFKFNKEGNLRQTSAREVQKVEYLPFSDALFLFAVEVFVPSGGLLGGASFLCLVIAVVLVLVGALPVSP